MASGARLGRVSCSVARVLPRRCAYGGELKCCMRRLDSAQASYRFACTVTVSSFYFEYSGNRDISIHRYFLSLSLCGMGRAADLNSILDIRVVSGRSGVFSRFRVGFIYVFVYLLLYLTSR
jgi:hypothetical protein